MFGYIICNREALSEEERQRYQSVYCGLCHSLKRRYGTVERMGLNYDMTFLALYLGAMYEETEEQHEARCALHLGSKKQIAVNRYIDYAADMTVLMAYYNSLDDWEDERRVVKGLYSRLLRKDLDALKERYPRQCDGVERSIRDLHAKEQQKDALPDHVIRDAGKMVEELFVYREDFWSDKHRQFGYELGRFIYLMDAAMDYERDIHKHNYNPLVAMQKRPTDMEQILSIMIGNASALFESMPVVQDVNILRNILYSGVWLRYQEKLARKDKKHE